MEKKQPVRVKIGDTVHTSLEEIIAIPLTPLGKEELIGLLQSSPKEKNEILNFFPTGVPQPMVDRFNAPLLQAAPPEMAMVPAPDPDEEDPKDDEGAE